MLDTQFIRDNARLIQKKFREKGFGAVGVLIVVELWKKRMQDEHISHNRKKMYSPIPTEIN